MFCMDAKYSQLPAECGVVLTAEVLLNRCCRRSFWRDVERLSRVGYCVEVEEGRGWLDRKFTVTADIAVLTWLFGAPGSCGR